MLFLSALEKSTGSFEKAVETVGHLLNVNGRVLPASLTPTRLGLRHGTPPVTVMGEHIIDEPIALQKPYTFFLEPKAVINPKAKEAILEADVIIIGPGTLSTSLIPVLLVDGMKETIAASKAKIVFNANLVQTPGQTDDFTVTDFVNEIELYLPRPIDAITFDSQPAAEILLGDIGPSYRVHGAPLRSQTSITATVGDPLVRSDIRHDINVLGDLLMEIINTL